VPPPPHVGDGDGLKNGDDELEGLLLKLGSGSELELELGLAAGAAALLVAVGEGDGNPNDEEGLGLGEVEHEEEEDGDVAGVGRPFDGLADGDGPGCAFVADTSVVRARARTPSNANAVSSRFMPITSSVERGLLSRIPVTNQAKRLGSAPGTAAEQALY
jgi:hypothetical protein